MKIPTIVLTGCALFGLATASIIHNPSDESSSAKVDELVREQMREQKIPGVSLAVGRNGKIIKATGYGLANVELNVPVTPQMVFNPGSLAKAFTATAVMMLIEEGKVGLDDKISKYLTESPAAWNEITIRRLLTHTSGLRDYFGEDGDPKYDFHQNFTEDELVRKFAAQTVRFPAGGQWQYNNAGYAILGVVIHRVTGKFWFDFVKERIFDPLGMTSSGLLSTDDVISNRVSGYQMVNGQRKNAPWLAASWLTLADGSLYTDVFDMAKWDAALYTEKLIKRSTLEQMWTPVKLNNGTTYPYGFGWRVSDVNGHRLIQHDGVDYAFTSRFARYVNDGLSVIVFMNLGEDDEAAMPKRMTDNVAAIYIPALGKGNGQPPPAAARETEQSTTSNQPTAQKLSAQQKDVWKGEEDSFRYLNAKSLKDYMSMWDANFVGWPDYNDRPVRKADIESSAAEEFRSSQTPSEPLPAPQPEAVAVFGDVAVTHYFWPEVDQTSPTIYRIPHTWQKGRDGWHIIGGMSCSVPRTAEATPDATRTPQSDEAQVLEIDRAWGQAYVKGDIDVIDRTLAPDWRGWLDKEGSDKARELSEFKAGKNRSLENIIDNADVRIYGNTAVVEARERVRFRDQTGEHWLTWHITDVFVKLGGQWRVVASHGSTIPNP
jgi:CubicO group peptidase (beta-lactamase class C family)/ketosteroid isomerase-like protein